MDNPSAEDLASKGAKRRKRKQQAYEKHQAELNKKYDHLQTISDQKRVFMHISSWSDWKYKFLVFTVLSIISALPFYFMLYGMDYASKEIAEKFISIFTFLIILNFGLWIFSIYMHKRKIKQEKLWLDSLPFEMKGYPDFFVYRAYSVFDLTFNFKNKQPDIEFILNILANLPYDHKAEYDTTSEESLEEILTLEESVLKKPKKRKPTYKIEVSNEKASKFNRHRRWARKWIHKAVDTHILAIHQKYPIESITFGTGKKELPDNWWVPIKRKKP